MAQKTKTRRTVYRDRLTGRFAKRSTWRRSRTQGGTKYVRQRVRTIRKPARKLRKARKPRLLRPAALPGIRVRVGYDSKDNSYTLIVEAKLKRGETLPKLSDRISRFSGRGGFDKEAKSFKVRDLRWATFYNAIRKVRDLPPGAVAPAKLTLVGFERRAP